MKTVDLSFITINYNSSEFTIKLIESIKKFTTLSYEIIIVDNASQQIDYELLKNYVSDHQNIQLIKNRINSGFASGNMLGVNYASGEYYLRYIPGLRKKSLDSNRQWVSNSQAWRN